VTARHQRYTCPFKRAGCWRWVFVKLHIWVCWATAREVYVVGWMLLRCTLHASRHHTSVARVQAFASCQKRLFSK